MELFSHAEVANLGTRERSDAKGGTVTKNWTPEWLEVKPELIVWRTILEVVR